MLTLLRMVATLASPSAARREERVMRSLASSLPRIPLIGIVVKVSYSYPIVAAINMATIVTSTSGYSTKRSRTCALPARSLFQSCGCHAPSMWRPTVCMRSYPRWMGPLVSSTLPISSSRLLMLASCLGRARAITTRTMRNCFRAAISSWRRGIRGGCRGGAPLTKVPGTTRMFWPSAPPRLAT